MKKLRVRKLNQRRSRVFNRCPIVNRVMETGERLTRGCGGLSMVTDEIGGHCLYCGNFYYKKQASLEVLWFHFKISREYWSVRRGPEQEYINGFPVDGIADSLPGILKSDLDEAHPPEWFSYFMNSDEEQFKKYLQERWKGN